MRSVNLTEVEGLGLGLRLGFRLRLRFGRLCLPCAIASTMVKLARTPVVFLLPLASSTTAPEGLGTFPRANLII